MKKKKESVTTYSCLTFIFHQVVKIKSIHPNSSLNGVVQGLHLIFALGNVPLVALVSYH
jgi:hypothetical protein